MNVKIKRLRKTAKLPTMATEYSAGYDIYADINYDALSKMNRWSDFSYADNKSIYMIEENKHLSVYPGTHIVVPTGIAISLPRNLTIRMGDTEFPVQLSFSITPRSGLSSKYGISVLNSPGIIDADYTGEIGVILANNGRHDFKIEQGMRIAQMILRISLLFEWLEVDILPTTERGDGGFGSTSLK